MEIMYIICAFRLVQENMLLHWKILPASLQLREGNLELMVLGNTNSCTEVSTCGCISLDGARRLGTLPCLWPASHACVYIIYSPPQTKREVQPAAYSRRRITQTGRVDVGMCNRRASP